MLDCRAGCSGWGGEVIEVFRGGGPFRRASRARERCAGIARQIRAQPKPSDEGSMLAPRAWSDVDEAHWLQQVNAMPLASRDDAHLAGSELAWDIRRRLTPDLDPARDDVDELIPVRVQFAVVRRIAGHFCDSHHQPVATRRRTGSMFYERHGPLTGNRYRESCRIDLLDALHRLLPAGSRQSTPVAVPQAVGGFSGSLAPRRGGRASHHRSRTSVGLGIWSGGARGRGE